MTRVTNVLRHKIRRCSALSPRLRRGNVCYTGAGAMSVGPKDAAKQKGKDGAALVKTMVARSALGALTIDGRALVVNLAVARTDAVRVRRGTAQHAHANVHTTSQRMGCGGALHMHTHAVVRRYRLCGPPLG